MTDTCPECGQSRQAAAVALQYIRTSDYWFEHAQLMEAERDTARANLQEMIDTENVLVDEAAEYDRLARVAKASRAKWQARALALRERVKTLEAENASAVAQIGDLARRCTDDTEYLRERVAALEGALKRITLSVDCFGQECPYCEAEAREGGEHHPPSVGALIARAALEADR